MYNRNDIKINQQGKKYYKTKIYPEIPYSETDIYVISNIGDRVDLYANTYYKDVSLKWIIYSANLSVHNGSIFIPPGTQVRIPINVTDIINQYNKLNSNR